MKGHNFKNRIEQLYLVPADWAVIRANKGNANRAADMEVSYAGDRRWTWKGIAKYLPVRTGEKLDIRIFQISRG